MKEISLQTRAQTEMIDITSVVCQAMREDEIEDGICLVYTPPRSTSTKTPIRTTSHTI